MLDHESPTSANLGNDYGFIIKEYSLPIGMRPLGEDQSKAMRTLLKVDNIISLWSFVLVYKIFMDYFSYMIIKDFEGRDCLRGLGDQDI